MISGTASTLPAIAYGYCRVSRDTQFQSHLGLEAQKAEMKRYYDWRLKDKAVWGDVFGDDRAISAKVPLFDRDAGRELNNRLKPGDHVIFPAIDRPWRNLRDALETIHIWEERGINLHFAKEGIDLGDKKNPLGKMFVYMLAVFAEMERERIRERTQDALAAKRARGEKWSKPPWGWKVVRKRRVMDENERAVMSYIRHLIEVEKLSNYQVRALFLREKRPNRTTKDDWSETTLTRAYRAAVKLNLPPMADPPPIKTHEPKYRKKSR